jgi:hypothetical protein
MVGWFCIVVHYVLLFVDHPVQWLESPRVKRILLFVKDIAFCFREISCIKGMCGKDASEPIGTFESTIPNEWDA